MQLLMNERLAAQLRSDGVCVAGSETMLAVPQRLLALQLDATIWQTAMVNLSIAQLSAYWQPGIVGLIITV